MQEEKLLRARFEALREDGRQAIDAGRVEEALGIYEDALSLAEAIGEPDFEDLALCNRAAAAIELGRGEREITRMREILLRSRNAENCRLAAYNVAHHYERIKEFKKALFYARIALERSRTLGRGDWIASSYNQIGNTLLAESKVEEAIDFYVQGLAIWQEASPRRAVLLDNLGYCRVLQGRRREGYALIYQSLRMLHRLAALPYYQISPRLDLCFTHLESGRYHQADRHGRIALVLAEQLGNQDAMKNALYLLGEAASLRGDEETAHGHFSRLQQTFFPDQPYLPEFLLAIDIRKLINLKA